MIKKNYAFNYVDEKKLYDYIEFADNENLLYLCGPKLSANKEHFDK